MAKKLAKAEWDAYIDKLIDEVDMALDYPDDEPDDYGGSSGIDCKPIKELRADLKKLWNK